MPRSGGTSPSSAAPPFSLICRRRFFRKLNLASGVFFLANVVRGAHSEDSVRALARGSGRRMRQQRPGCALSRDRGRFRDRVRMCHNIGPGTALSRLTDQTARAPDCGALQPTPCKKRGAAMIRKTGTSFIRYRVKDSRGRILLDIVSVGEARVAVAAWNSRSIGLLFPARLIRLRVTAREVRSC